MTTIWLGILVLWGFIKGFETIHPLFWLLAIVWFCQDMFDYKHHIRGR